MADDPVAVGEDDELVFPHPAVRDPRVYEDQRVPFSSNLVVDPRAVDLGHACLSEHLFPFPDTSLPTPFPCAGWHAGTRVLSCFRRDILSEDASVARMGKDSIRSPPLRYRRVSRRRNSLRPAATAAPRRPLSDPPSH